MKSSSDLTYALKQAVSTALNRHRPGRLPNIAMFSSRRSGTTLVAQVFGRAPEIKAIDQPLSSYTASAEHSRYLPPFAGSYPYDLSPEDRSLLKELFLGWHTGQLHFSEPWRAWSPEFKWRSSRLFLKFTEGHAIAHEIPNFIPIQSFAFFRHPIPHALSCLRLGWSARGGNFLQQTDLLSAHFDDKKVDFIRRRDREGDRFERLLLNWFVENAPLLQLSRDHPVDFPTFTFEDLILRPVEQLKAIASHCEVRVTESMIAGIHQPSRSSSMKKTGSDIAALLRTGDQERILSSWQQRLSPHQREVSTTVFDVLGCSIYSSSSPLPHSFH